ncbi:Uncharacterized protein Fot_25719 [Forsythia ovata]|uniref:Uncharacterized protein n=1 Tax=Forsythia ovata TaxID=205694 RepID=A0ABD1U9Z9_9LAMI
MPTGGIRSKPSQCIIVPSQIYNIEGPQSIAQLVERRELGNLSFADSYRGRISCPHAEVSAGGQKISALELCDRKLIGARYFARDYEAALCPIDHNKESRSPRDDGNHGTYTSSMGRAQLFWM